MSDETSKLRRIGALIANDAFAISYQSLGQYRAALLSAVVDALKPERVSPPEAVEFIGRRFSRDG